MKNLKILINYFLSDPLGCALVDPNVAGTGGPGRVTVGHSGSGDGGVLGAET
jgi:hypothetical protein